VNNDYLYYVDKNTPIFVAWQVSYLIRGLWHTGHSAPNPAGVFAPIPQPICFNLVINIKNV